MRKRLRVLRLDGRSFVWTARIRCCLGEGDCHRGVRVRIWGAGKNGRVAQADLLSKSWPAPWGACATDGAYPTSADVRALIGHGLVLGWDVDAVGGVFMLRDYEWELPGFLLTGPDAPDPTARVIAAFERARSSRHE